MIEERLAWLSNYLWQQSIDNINEVIGENNKARFTNTDYFNLSMIYSLGKPQFSELAEALGVSKPAVSLIIKRLMALDLVEKKQSEEDKRIFYIHVTERGKKIVGGDYRQYEQLAGLIKHHAKDSKEYDRIDAILGEVISSIQQGK